MQRNIAEPGSIRGQQANEDLQACGRLPSARQAPARTPTTRLSVNNCCTNLLLEAPSAPRTAISRSRPLVRARVRLATFAQAISRINPTAPNSSRSLGRTAPTSACSSGSPSYQKPRIRHSPGKQRQQDIVQSAQFRLSLRRSDSSFQTAESSQIKRLPRFNRIAALERDGDDKLRVGIGKAYACRHDSKNGAPDTVNRILWPRIVGLPPKC